MCISVEIILLILSLLLTTIIYFHELSLFLKHADNDSGGWTGVGLQEEKTIREEKNMTEKSKPFF